MQWKNLDRFVIPQLLNLGINFLWLFSISFLLFVWLLFMQPVSPVSDTMLDLDAKENIPDSWNSLKYRG